MTHSITGYLGIFSLLILSFSCNIPSQDQAIPSNLSKTGYISNNGAEIYYKTIGSGIPIVVLHGGPGMEHTYFLPHLNQFTDTYQFIFFDQRISGKSSWLVDSSLISMEAFTSDIEAIRKHFNLKKINLLGHSWGGLLAMWYATNYPEKLESLTLVSTIPANKAYETEAMERNQSNFREKDLATMQELRNSEGIKAGEKASILQLYKLNFSGAFFARSYLDSLFLDLPENFGERQRRLAFLMGDLASYDLYDKLPNIKAPTLLIHGDYDATPLKAIEKIKENIPNSQLVVLKNTGHFPFIESKTSFKQALDQFLQQ